ncbi:hypothetical protein KR093_008596 [Drosophila rubida]|uniref:Uncharacterized protein n=1 Tax=Drosophila rubida TaxID=30044 RepID=A0AAD4JWK4_9MUSC|nr:hypothetical protein KR093_008596 [Drosophila rubida]
MNILGYLKQYVERRHRKLGLLFAFFALFTLLLEQSYVRDQQDLLYWLEQLTVVRRHPYKVIAVILLAIMFQFVLMVVQRRIEWLTCGIFAETIRKYRSRKFADFIMRRLLWHLELAMLRMPVDLKQNILVDPEVQKRFQLAKDKAYLAVDVFRRDAAALLLNRMPLTSEDSPFFILKEEEQALLNGGYSRIKLRVSSDVLKQLLYPQSKSLD